MGGRGMRMRSLLFALAFLAACSDNELAPVADPPALAPLAPFASDTMLVVSSEGTLQNLAVLSLNTATGAVGSLPGSPVDVKANIGDAETLAADPARRRVFLGSNIDGVIAVCDLDLAGRPVPVAGSPFAAERRAVSSMRITPAGDSLFVGYHAESILSRYAVSPAGTLTLAQSIPTVAGSFVETMRQVGNVLYVGFLTTSNIVGYQLDGGGAFVVDGDGLPTIVADVTTAERPDDLIAIETRLYCSLAQAGAIDAFTVGGDGSLTRLAGAPYTFPGIGGFELIAAQPGGAFIAVGAETPTAAVGLYAVAPDGTLIPNGAALTLHDRRGGPEGLTFSADGRFLFVCDHVGQGLYVLETTGGVPAFAAMPRFELPGRQIDVLRLNIAVDPN